MKVIHDIKDDKVSFIMELLKNFSFVKAKPVAKKDEFLEDLKESVKQVKLAKQGKIKLKSAEDLLNEL